MMTAVLLAWAVLLCIRFSSSAGPLWRDEANSAAQAGLAEWSDLWSSLQYDSFPVLYPSALRLWISCPFLAGDRGLRVLGLCVGMAALLSVWLVSRTLHSPEPLVSLALVSIDPVFVSESCSIRPHGLGVVFLLWVYHAQWRCFMLPSAPRILMSAMLSILAVQASYNSAIFIGVFGISSAVISFARGEGRKGVRMLVPGACAALSLLPYSEALRKAQNWVALLHCRVSWREFFDACIARHTIAYPAVWAAVLVLAAFCILRRLRHPAEEASPPPALHYTLMSAAMGLVCQVLFIQWIGIPPFPRYLLPVLVLAAFAFQSVIGNSARRFQFFLVIAVMLATGRHAWSSLGLRRTNADHVAMRVSQEARSPDLIVVSPWFLHPSFARYYQGDACWVTVPLLPHSPITRYDLFRSAMMARDPSAAIAETLSAAMRSGGRVWLVHQVIGWVPGGDDALEVPPPPESPDGHDYVRFRSYWERDIWHRLRSCCSPQEVALPASDNVWEEERLRLTLFRKR
ncbi:MAG: hypothetical protein HXY20_07225 [Acidobacteria bacterium]|nr:hypothetical protein [Acidobacteriota bacterium]